MRLRRLTLRNFRGVADRTVEFAERGVTVVVGDNETGKSSLLEAFGLLIDLPAESAHARVRAVRPIGRDVGPEVGAAVELEGLALEYRKRWSRDRETELRVTEPSGRVRAYTGREAHDEAARLFAEHVDPTLWDALVVGQTETLAMPAPREVRSVLARLQAYDLDGLEGPHGVEGPDVLGLGEFEGLELGEDGGGEPEVPLAEAVEREFRRSYTSTGRPTGEYALAERVLGLRTAELETLQRQAGEVEADVRRAERLAQDRERLRVRLAEADAAVVRLDNQRSAATDLVSRVERLRGEAEVARARLDTITAEYARRRELAAELEARGAALEAACAAAEDAGTALRDGDAELMEATGRLRTAREAHGETRARVGRLDRRLATVRDARDLAESTARAEAVRAYRAERDRARAELAANPVDADAAERLEAIHRDLLTARAAAHAGAPKLVVEPLGEPAVVTVDGVPLDAELDSVVERETRIAVDGVVAVTVRPGDGSAALHAEVARAEHAERAQLDALGLPDVAAARSALRARQAAEQALAGAERAVADRLAGSTVEELEARRAALAARLDALGPDDDPAEPDDPDAAADPAEPDDPDAADAPAEPAASVGRDPDPERIRVELDTARAAEAAAGTELDSAEDAEVQARKGFEAARDNATTARVRVEQETERRAEVAAALDSARAERSDPSLDEAFAAATRAAQDVLGELRTAQEELEAAGVHRVAAELETAQAGRVELARQVEAYTGDLRQVEGRLEMAGAQGIATAVETARAAREQAVARFEILDRRARAASRLRDTLERHRAEAHRRYAAPLRERIDVLGRVVYGPSFAVLLDDELEVEARDLDGVQLPVSALSTGAVEQLATVVRLAVAGLTARDGSGVPVVLDDALGWSDPGRLVAMNELFQRAGETAQIVLLTCMPDRYAWIRGASVVRL